MLTSQKVPLLARPEGHRWPGHIDALSHDEHIAQMDYALDGALIQNGGQTLRFDLKLGVPDFDAELREDALRGIMESV